MRNPRTLLLAALVLTTVGLQGACQKFKGPQEPKKAEPAATKKAAVEEKAPAPEPEEVEPTFAEKAADSMKEMASGAEACVEKFLSKVDMKQIEDGFLPVDLNQMDKLCRRPIEHYKRIGRKLEGQHPVCDAYLEHAAAFSDSFLRMSFRMKQIGARERWKVVRDIEKHRDLAKQHAARLVEGAREIGAWPADTAPATDVREESVDATAYRERASELVTWLVERMPKVVKSYEESAFRPAEVQESIFFFSFRYAHATSKRWFELGQKRFEALTCTGEPKACEKVKKNLDEVVAAAGLIFDAYERGLRFYRKDYFKRLDDAVPIHDDMKKALEAFMKQAKKSGL